jgi:hypothetical protein
LMEYFFHGRSWEAEVQELYQCRDRWLVLLLS